MNCISEGTLRAYRDGELDARERLETEKHLEECADCRKLSDELGSIADRVHDHLLALDALADGSPVDSRVALARFKAQHEGNKEETSVMWRLFAKGGRPVWGGAVAFAFVAVCLTFPPMRSLAQKFLETLRVEKVQ